MPVRGGQKILFFLLVHDFSDLVAYFQDWLAIVGRESDDIAGYNLHLAASTGKRPVENHRLKQLITRCSQAHVHSTALTFAFDAPWGIIDCHLLNVGIVTPKDVRCVMPPRP